MMLGYCASKSSNRDIIITYLLRPGETVCFVDPRPSMFPEAKPRIHVMAHLMVESGRDSRDGAPVAYVIFFRSSPVDNVLFPSRAVARETA
jgi:hypothetical protein